MVSTVPPSEDLREMAEMLKGKWFLYITSFADILTRYSEINFKMPLRFTALSLLIRKGGNLTPTELSQMMFRSKHSITKIIDGLEKDGYVIRVRDKKDRRSLHVRITAKGLNHVRRNIRRGDEHVRELISCLSEDEWQNLLNYIKKLRIALIEKMRKMEPFEQKRK